MLVTRINDHSNDPIVGEVVGREDRDRVLVLWGDARFGDHYEQARVEWIDQLAAGIDG